MIAIAPTATIASIAGCYECIEPQVSNLFKRETLSGEFLQINRYLVQRTPVAWTVGREMINDVKQAEGSVQDIERIPDDLKETYRTAWEIPMRSLIDMAAERGAFIDQSQSLNLFMESPTIGKLSSMYMYAWKAGLKTTYYLRHGLRPVSTRRRRPRPTAAPAPTAPAPVGASKGVHRRRGTGLFTREPRDLRGLRLIVALIDPCSIPERPLPEALTTRSAHDYAETGTRRSAHREVQRTSSIPGST